MNIELNNSSEYEVEYVEKEESTPVRKYRKFQVLIYLGCLLLAFLVWCYANYLDDPIIQKEVTLVITLDGVHSDKLLRSTHKIVIYGEKSVISEIDEIRNNVNQNEFVVGSTTITKEIDFPEGVHSHETTVEVKLRDESK